ncbi:MAG: hypothetical protein BZ137_02505 [Methanosphaera sp. rholeuAM130]|nr:MAG: hypothetical protein BZ137_02505 [Methanosphaera sp. rholeuAM130]
MNSINTRCSTRVFDDRKISKDDLERIIQSAFCAPSACNLQPWHFIVIDDEDTLRDMVDVHEYASMFKTATAGIIVCGDMNKTIKNHEEFWTQDCSAATQNVLLAGHALGIGSVWTGIYPVKKRCEYLRDYFDLPENIVPFSLIALGYAKDKSNVLDKYDQEKVHHNHW